MMAQARKLSPSGSLGWAEGGPKCRAQSSDGDGAVELLSKYSCFRLSLGRFLAWPIELDEQLGSQLP